MTGYSAPVDCEGQAAIAVTKHVPDVVSQQFELPLGADGQLFWQSPLDAHDVGHALPPPLLDELLPPLEFE